MWDLTPEERKVILFLGAITLLGTGVNFYCKKFPAAQGKGIFYQDLGKINLACADKDLLMTVPGIGKKLAERILEYRSKVKAFSAVEELKQIKGISNSKYEKIKDFFILR